MAAPNFWREVILYVLPARFFLRREQRKPSHSGLDQEIRVDVLKHRPPVRS